MWIKDRLTGRVFKYGENPHDALVISEDGRCLTYENLQNGDGSKYGDYVFTDENGNIPNDIDSIEYGRDYFDIGGKMMRSLEDKDLKPYEELPIDIDDLCDSCEEPRKWNCFNTDECRKDYPFLECCKDNLQENIGKILFEHDIVDHCLAKAIIDIIKKERKRNESLYVHREYFKGE